MMASRYTDKTEISRNEYLQLVGLLVLAKRHNDALDEIVRAAAEITGESDEYGGFGLTGDVAYGHDPDADALLRHLEITVRDDTAADDTQG
jgi:hypothetical protein